MSQGSVNFCSNCNANLAPDQRFCPRCGTVIDAGAHQRTVRPSAADAATDYFGTTMSATPPPPPPPPSSLVQQPPYSGTPKNSAKSVRRRIGCGVLSVILLVVVLGGAVSYFGYNRLKGSGTTGGGGTQTGGNTVTDATSSSLKTTSLVGAQPLSVIYADVKITLIDAKQAKSFADDSSAYNTSQEGITRLDFKEEENTQKAPNYIYTDIMRLILPNGTTVSPITAKNSGSPDISTTRQNWIDFPVSTNLTISNMVLRIGADTEQQMQIPLKPNADVSKYQPKTITVNKQTQYTGVTWTVTNAVASWSADGKQAEKGMTYVVVSLKVDNTSSSDFNADPGDYLRLKTGAVTAAPASTTIPLSFAQGQTGVTGNATFQVPQGSTDFSLIFLATPSVSGSQQAAIPFQIP